jgi:hypothetical protein
MPPQGIDGLMYLGGQLARWGEDQRPDPAARPVHELLEERQHERRRLAGAGLGQAEHVTPVQYVGDGFFLDGGRMSVSLLVNGRRDVSMKIEWFECHEYSFVCVCLARVSRSSGKARSSEKPLVVDTAGIL